MSTIPGVPPKKASTNLQAPSESGTQPTSIPMVREAAAPRRTDKKLLLGSALAVVLGVGGTYLAVSNSLAREPVCVFSKAVVAGQEIQEEHITGVGMSADAGVATIPYSQRHTVIGQVAVAAMPEGTIVGDKLVSAKFPLPKGEALVPIPVKLSQVPATGLRVGSSIRIVPVTGPNGQQPVAPAVASKAKKGIKEAVPSDAVLAKVVSVGSHRDQATGISVVDVSVPTTAADAVASITAGGNFAIVVEGQG